MLRKTTLFLALFLASSLSVADTHVLMTTSSGKIELLLDEQKAPKTVENFVHYADKGFYNGTIFHRVIPGFMIQGGGFTPEMKQKPVNHPIINEAANKLKNTVGSIAMARTSDPDSATSQFFINVANNDALDHQNNTAQGMGYAVFGRVIKGMDVVNRIAAEATGNYGMHQDVPKKTVKIISVKILNPGK